MTPIYLPIDFETGGLDAAKNPITEVGLCAIDGKTLKFMPNSELNFYVQPYDNLIIEQQALDASMVTLVQIQAGETGEDAFLLLREYFKEHKVKAKGYDKGLPVIVAHNAGFDISFLEKLFAVYSDNIFKYIQRVPQCTYQLSQGAYGHKGIKLRLTNICEYQNIVLTDAHSALNDAIACGRVFINYMQALRGKTHKIENNEVEVDLLDFKF